MCGHCGAGYLPLLVPVIVVVVVVCWVRMRMMGMRVMRMIEVVVGIWREGASAMTTLKNTDEIDPQKAGSDQVCHVIIIIVKNSSA